MFILKYCIFNCRSLIMKKFYFLLFLLFCFLTNYAQKDSLQIGDKYAEDQIYLSVSYAQFFNQPQQITKSGFSYGLSIGFLKDITLNKQGNFSFAVGVGYGFDSFSHELKVEEINGNTVFSNGSNLTSNNYTASNLEFPLEIRWRTSNAKRYDFWRIYGGVKFLYNLSNKFNFTENSTSFEYKNVNAYRKFQYGLTLSAGYDEFNFNVFYSLTPIFENASFNGASIDTSVLKFGLIFYIL